MKASSYMITYQTEIQMESQEKVVLPGEEGSCYLKQTLKNTQDHNQQKMKEQKTGGEQFRQKGAAWSVHCEHRMRCSIQEQSERKRAWMTSERSTMLTPQQLPLKVYGTHSRNLVEEKRWCVLGKSLYLLLPRINLIMAL